MLNRQLLNPESIVVVGASNNTKKPGGKLLKNLLDNQYKGRLFVVNPKESQVQGIKSYSDVSQLPDCELAILAIAAKFCPETVEILVKNKKTMAFVIISAGFSEEGEEGARYEKQVIELINGVNGCLIGPNCIGVMNNNHSSVFTSPIPKLKPDGIDFISGSGATAVYILETGIPRGLTFSSVFSVGNSAQMGVEEVLQYMDENFDPKTSSRVKLLYLESVNKPQMLLKHASSLINKGCKIAAIKSGTTEAGSRAASSHTGALANSDLAVDALFRKAGIVRCYSREELTAVASVFMHKELKNKNLAIITHAGGPAVMLTDTLSQGGINVPDIGGPFAVELLEKLYPGSTVSNPIDFLATGNAEQLGHIISYCETKFNEIDGMVVIFGSPGLCEVYEVYDLLDEKMKTAVKPIFPVLPSIINAKNEIEYFLSKGRIYFPDEVILGKALTRVYNTQAPEDQNFSLPEINKSAVREIIEKSVDGYLSPQLVQGLLDAAGIARVREAVVTSRSEAVLEAVKLRLPVVMKVVGPVHKSDVGGVVLNVSSPEQVQKEFDRMVKIPETTAILMQPMLSGLELYAGAKAEPGFGHLVLLGMGGIYLEILKDVNAGLSPISNNEALSIIRQLKGYGIIKGARGQKGINEYAFADIITRLSALLKAAPEIAEMDLNPLLGNNTEVIAVDGRIRIER